ncbi:hypothetical protein KXW60_003497 [Aspergillus fumigatus]|nr:hypothetical protein KXW60_003497 [Aspergillus fumigatus]KAH3270698.1 hypothetical protein KXW55_002129 [Aspergillus fumigatus]
MWPVKSLRGPDGLPDMEALIQVTDKSLEKRVALGPGYWVANIEQRGHGVGSFVLVDAVTANTPSGTLTSLYSTNSTAFLLQNVEFYNIEKAIMAEQRADPILAGGGRTTCSLMHGALASTLRMQMFNLLRKVLPTMQRAKELVSPISYNKGTFNFSPAVDHNTPILDTASVFTVAVNLSSIVYIPHGVYKVTDTLKIPKGSRIIGQAWSQIMATGPKFQDADDPHVAVQVPPLELSWWNEISMNLARGRQDYGVSFLSATYSHFRVGGAKGSHLQASECPKKQFPLIKQDYIAASLLLRITSSASAYLENVWAWTADHDLDVKSQDPIDVFSARGILVESHGPTWMYGTASEHNVLYQYQLPGAQKIVMGMIQTETPYFQPLPAAPESFKPAGCAMAWAVRIINSSTVYILGSGLYSWLAFYTQDCLETGDCQEQGFYVEQSTNTWVYNLVTKGITESISPAGETPLYARDVQNGYASSLLAWLHTGTGAIGKRKFPGFYLWDGEMDRDVLSGVSSTCKASLTRLVECHDQVYMLRALQWRGSMHNDTLTDLMCDKTCGQSLQLWFESVLAGCAREQDHVVLAEPGGIIWAGWNETCVKDPNTEKYCGDAINEFTVVRSLSDMPHSELCSYCYVTRYKMMQATPYSIYDKTYQSDLEFIHSKCGLSGPTSILPPLQEFPDP